MTNKTGRYLGEVKEAQTFKKEIVLIRGYFIEMKDEFGQAIYTFKTKKQSDRFYKELMATHLYDHENITNSDTKETNNPQG